MRFVYLSVEPIVKCYVVFRKDKSRKAAKAYRDGQKEYVRKLENRNAILEYQNEALIQELKTLKQLYEKNTVEQKQTSKVIVLYFMNFFP